MRGGEPRGSERDGRREIPFRYVSPFEMGFGGGSRERGGGGGGRSDPFDDFFSRSGIAARVDMMMGFFSDGDSDWSDGFW